LLEGEASETDGVANVAIIRSARDVFLALLFFPGFVEKPALTGVRIPFGLIEDGS
jgi:hypothetical protein